MGVDIPRKFWQALGTVKDQVSIGKAMMIHNPNCYLSEIEVAVVHATAHDNTPVEDKHVHEILFLVSNNSTAGGSISFLAERLSRRLSKTKDRHVALKTLFLIHRLLRGGNRGFEQRLRNAHLSGHLQIGSNSWNSGNPSFCFIHKYAAYVEERMEWVINQAGKLEPADLTLSQQCLGLGKFLFYGLPKFQVLIDKVLDCSSFDILPCDLLAQAVMTNILKESFQVYAAFCEVVEAVVSVFFDLTEPTRSLACSILKKASQQTQKLSDFYENCKEVMGNNKNLEYPTVQVIAIDHITALEQVSCTVLDCRPPKSAEMMQVITKKVKEVDEKDEERRENIGVSSTLFSCTMETKISNVWVVFDEDDTDESSSISF